VRAVMPKRKRGMNLSERSTDFDKLFCGTANSLYGVPRFT
jgi:hypothetical protein